MSFSIVGFDNNYLVPRFAGQIVFGAGTLSAASAQMRVLLVGQKLAGGTLATNAAPSLCQSLDDADVQCGAGSELARMAYVALKVPGTTVYLAAVPEPAGTAATATLLLGGTWTVGGTWSLRLAGQTLTGSVAASDTVSTIGPVIAAAINAQTRLPFTAAFSVATITITAKQLGARTKDWILYWDATQLPTGFTTTLTGSSAINTNGVRFGASASGTGTEDVTTVLTKVLSQRYARIACASNDATNAPLFRNQVNAKAGPLSLLFENIIFGWNNAQATAQTLAQTTLNAQRAQVLWSRNCESHPAEIAAANAAMRAGREQTDPVPDYDGNVLLGIAPQAFDADLHTDVEKNLCLNNGVTPLDTVNGTTVVVRAITSYCLLGGTTQDTRTLDIGDAVFPDFAMIDLQLMYATDYRPNNKYVGPDNAPEEFEPPEGIGTPKVWNAKVTQRLKVYFDNKWIESPTGANLPSSEYNSASKRIMSSIPLVVRRVQHQLGSIIRQTASAG